MNQYLAPAVRYPLKTPRVLLRVLKWWVLCNVLLTLWWAVQGAGSGWQQVWGACIGLGLCAGTARWAWQAVHALPRGSLEWDGAQWLCLQAQATWALQGAPQVMVDLPGVLAMRIPMVGRSPHRPVWLWCERAAAPARWGDLRRAVYSPLPSFFSSTSAAP